MSNLSTYFNALLFLVLPYVALFTFFLVTIVRYRTSGFSYSSLSSQFLENRQHFWALMPFHYGILTVLAVHIAAFLIPRQVVWWNRVPARLWIMETGMLAAGLLTLAGLVAAMARRRKNRKIAVVTTPSDWIILVLLLLQVISGLGVAILHPWGSSWFAIAVTPYLRSVATLNPNMAVVAAMPPIVKVHVINAFLVIGFFPFTRLVHILVAPNPYLWRRPQVVRWYRRPAAARG
ncbi:MAG: respiratory nitrate reductase subunit gamma [Acidobacteriota bacterium]|nr:respiratory nitrate reductase subunit gamma [Acidobacteriota bacterium]